MSKMGRRTFLGTILGAAMGAMARPLLASVPKVESADSLPFSDAAAWAWMDSIQRDLEARLLDPYADHDLARPTLHIERGPGNRVTVWQTWIPSA